METRTYRQKHISTRTHRHTQPSIYRRDRRSSGRSIGRNEKSQLVFAFLARGFRGRQSIQRFVLNSPGAGRNAASTCERPFEQERRQAVSMDRIIELTLMPLSNRSFINHTFRIKLRRAICLGLYSFIYIHAYSGSSCRSGRPGDIDGSRPGILCGRRPLSLGSRQRLIDGHGLMRPFCPVPIML